MITFSGHPAAVEGRADGGPAGHGQDHAGEGRGHRVRDHVLQRVLLHAHLQVPRRVRETSQTALRNGTNLILKQPYILYSTMMLMNWGIKYY